MGDRTAVNLIVRGEDFENYKEIFDGSDGFEDYKDNLVSLNYCDVNYAELEFEEALQAKRIPYDKFWDSGDEYINGSEYCRVLANGSIVVDVFNGNEDEVVILDDVISAYTNGQIESFLESEKNKRTVMRWEDQEVIISGRKETAAYLLDLDQDSLDALVVELSCELSKEIASAEGEDIQDNAILSAEKTASDINNQGKDGQIGYLLNHGYLPHNINAHIVLTYSLPIDKQAVLTQ